LKYVIVEKTLIKKLINTEIIKIKKVWIKFEIKNPRRVKFEK
jgi:hypothetical protein